MTEEKNDEQKSEPEQHTKKPQNADGDLQSGVEKIETEAYQRRKAELEALEKRVDGKIKELNSIVDESRAAGVGFSMPRTAPPKLSDVEYAKKVMRGEANPLKDDGFVR